jgi:putative NADH-flavin reductase
MSSIMIHASARHCVRLYERTASESRCLPQERTPRLVVGGAGGLFVAPGVTAIASGHLPEVALPIAKAHEQVRQDLAVSGADWTYFAPAGLFEPGERTGKFRLGKDDLVVDASGNSRVSMEDYAIAAVDELEKPKHRGQRFTIGY